MAFRIKRFSFQARPSFSKVKVKVSAAFFSPSLLEAREEKKMPNRIVRARENRLKRRFGENVEREKP